MGQKPLVSIVTPAFNSSRFIEQTLRSIREQRYDDIEHIVIDGGSTDGTIDILEKYEDEHDLVWISEPDEGMYEAIEKGFQEASGDIYAWLNSDDMYMPWAVEVAVENLSKEGVEWIIGHPAYYNEDGVLHSVKELRPYFRRKWIKKGWYHGQALGWIQQESMFWTSDLWDKKGGFPDGIQYAGDYYLWRQFAEEADLVQVGTVLSGFREHDDQLTSDIDQYYEEIPETETRAKIYSTLFLDNWYSLMMNFNAIIR